MKIFIYCLVAFFSLTSFRIDEKVKYLYVQSILLHFEILDSDSIMKPDTIYILQDFKMELPVKIGRFDLVTVDEVEIKKILDRKGSFNAIRILPPESKKNYIQIDLVDFHLEYIDETKKEIAFINIGGQMFKFKMNKNQYRLVQTEKFG